MQRPPRATFGYGPKLGWLVAETVGLGFFTIVMTRIAWTNDRALRLNGMPIPRPAATGLYAVMALMFAGLFLARIADMAYWRTSPRIIVLTDATIAISTPSWERRDRPVPIASLRRVWIREKSSSRSLHLELGSPPAEVILFENQFDNEEDFDRMCNALRSRMA